MAQKHFKISIIVLITVLAAAAAVYAGTTGKISGRVTDAETGEPLIGANVYIVGTTLGAPTDENGNYAIIRVPPGLHVVEISYLGYKKHTVLELKVSVDLTTNLDAALTPETFVGEEVIVTAEAPLITKDLTATTARIDASDIEQLPVTEISEVLNLQAGYVDGHVRGGRSGEVAYWIDGIPVTDVYDGSNVVEVNKNMVQELQFISGAFNAEYGRAMSGIVNIITKTGVKEFSGGISTYGGDFVSGKKDIYPNVDDLNPFQIRNIEANLQGPLFNDKISFFINARAINFESAIYGKRLFNPQNIAYFDSIDVFQLYRDAEGKGDGKYVSMHGNRKYYVQSKLFYQLSNDLQLSLSTILDDVDYREWNSFDNERNYKYNPDGAPKKFRTGLINLLKIVHTINQNTFYELGFSYIKKTFEKYVYENPYDPRYVHPTLSEQLPFSYNTGGADISRFKRKTETMLAKIDLTNQFSQNHLFKLGLEFNKHNVFFEDIQLRPIEEHTNFNFASDSPYIKTRILDESTIYTSRYDKNPMEFSGYLQDKMEFGELIINAGIRFDYFSPDGVVLNDETDPNIYNPIRPENRYDDLNSNGIQDEGEPNITHAERASYWYKEAASKLQFSPRFGAAFPITDRGAFHFSYGHFFQIPNFQRLYQNPHFTIGSGTGNQGVIGNADLKPEKTVSGEVGVQQMITDNTSMDITGYFRDVRDLAGTRADEIIVFGGFARYSKIINSDFGFIRGVVLSLNHRFSSSLTSMLDFTYQIAKGSNSDPEQARNALAGGALPEVQLTPLNWDQRYTINVSFIHNSDPWSGSIIGKYGTGTPYTPRRSEDITSLLTNSQSKPHRYNVDLTVSRTFKASGFRMKGFVRILNVLDTMNQTNVYDDTGKAGFTTDLERVRIMGWPEFVNSLDDWYTNPLYYSEPRRVEFGLKVSF